MLIRLTVFFNMVAILLGTGVFTEYANAQQQQESTLKTSAVRNNELQPVEFTTNGFTENITGIQFVTIPGGCFSMGDSFDKGDADEKPVHKICLSDFAISKYDVTVGQFRLFVEATGYRTDAEKEGGCNILEGKDWKKLPGNSWKNPGIEQNYLHPVTCVNII